MRIEVIDLIFEFLLSVLVIAGGGVLIALKIGDATFITSMMALVIYFWFQSRSNTATVNNLLKQLPGLTPPIITPAQITVDPSSPVTAPATTNPTNPAAIPSAGKPPTGNNI